MLDHLTLHRLQIALGTPVDAEVIFNVLNQLTASDGVISFGTGLDLNGTELVLDADGDTSLAADTDDQIDVKIAGADDFKFTANTFTALAGSSIATDTIAETTSAAGVTIDGVLVKDGGLTLADAGNIATNATTGSKMCTAADQKLGFWGAPPVAQPAHIADPAAMADVTAAAIVTTNMEDGSADNTLVAIGDTSGGNESSNIELNFDKLADAINELIADVGAAKTAIDANNAAIDSILAQLATTGLHAAT